jgi:hypothetical protein
MTISPKDKASVRHGDMKRKLSKKFASMERQVVRMSAAMFAQAKERRERLALALERSAAKLRRASK